MVNPGIPQVAIHLVERANSTRITTLVFDGVGCTEVNSGTARGVGWQHPAGTVFLLLPLEMTS